MINGSHSTNQANPVPIDRSVKTCQVCDEHQGDIYA
jgi:hypothetical protein